MYFAIQTVDLVTKNQPTQYLKLLSLFCFVFVCCFFLKIVNYLQLSGGVRNPTFTQGFGEI